MNRETFARIMAYLAAGVGKPPESSTLEVYFDLLQDLPAEALWTAAKQALLESEYPVLPPVGALRKRAVEALAGASTANADEAWGMFRHAILQFGYNRQEEGLASLPPLVREVAERFGWQDVCGSTQPNETNRAQFRRAYEAAAERHQRQALLPPALKEQIARVAQAARVPALSPPPPPPPPPATLNRMRSNLPPHPVEPVIKLADHFGQNIQPPPTKHPKTLPPSPEVLERMRAGLSPVANGVHNTHIT